MCFKALNMNKIYFWVTIAMVGISKYRISPFNQV